MPIVSAYPTESAADGTAWTNPANAHADDGVYATAAPAKNATVASRWGTFGFDGLVPAGATINSVTLEAQWKVSVDTSIATLGFQAYVDGVAQGTEYTDAAEPLTDTIRTRVESSAYTRANLLDASFRVRLRATRGNSNTAFTASLDYLKVTVDYSLPPVQLSGVANGGSASGAQVAVTRGLSGQAVAAPTASAVLVLLRGLAGQATAVSSAVGSLTILGQEVLLAGQAIAGSAAGAVCSVVRGLVGQATPSPAASATCSVLRALAGLATGYSSALASLSVAGGSTPKPARSVARYFLSGG